MQLLWKRTESGKRNPERRDFFGGKYLGIFSDKDMEVHFLDLCESCYDSWVSGFAVPVEVQEATEIPGV